MRSIVGRFVWWAADSSFPPLRNLAWTLIEWRRESSKPRPSAPGAAEAAPVSLPELAEPAPAVDPNAPLPRITIITPTFRMGEFLERCIESVLSQDYPDLEYIVIDGGSDDGTVEILERYADRLTYSVSEPDDGQADAINKGLARATGTIVNWVNADDALEPGALRRVAEAWRLRPDAVGWVGGCRRVDLGGRVLNVIFPNGLDRENIGHNWNGRQFYQPSCFLSTEAVREVGGLCTALHFAFDLDLWLRVTERGYLAAGQGIWSSAIIHGGAKTTKLKEEMHRETVELQRGHGFDEGAERRFEALSQAIPQHYATPPSLRARLEQARVTEVSLELSPPPSITFVCPSPPRHDRSSSDFRIHNLLRLLLGAGCRIKFLHTVRSRDDRKYIRSLDGNIRFEYAEMNSPEFFEALTGDPPEWVWVTNLFGLGYFGRATGMAARLKGTAPGVRLVVDTMDLHFKKYTRKHEQDGEASARTTAAEYLALERRLYPLADVVTVVSEPERGDIVAHVPETGRVEVLPNVHEAARSEMPFAARRHIAFVGAYNVNHNRDAVRFFLEEIFDRILEHDPQIEFHVIGGGAADYESEFSRPNVRIVGFVPDLGRTLSKYKLFVCPLTYGAGLKGKLGSAASAGLPFVSTTCGAEGFPVRDGREGFVADDPTEFAGKCVQLLSDPICWNNFSRRSALMIAEHFGPSFAARCLERILSPAPGG